MRPSLILIVALTVRALIASYRALEPVVASAQVVTQTPSGRGMPPCDQPPGERKGTSIVRGRVTGLDTGRPLRRVRITLNARNYRKRATPAPAAMAGSRSQTFRLAATP